MNKKFLAMLMALAMIISMVPMAAMAASDTCSKNNVSGNHGYTTGPHLDATCGKDGYTSQVCEWCSEELTRTIVPATGNHNWKVVFRTETEVKYHCDGCNQDKTERIETVCKHEHQDTETVAATCGRDGVTKQICKDCGAVVRENVIEATGDHSWKSVSTIGGVERFECTVCGQEKTEPIKPECKHEHQTTETVAATCGRDGVTKQICKDCGAVVRENVIEASGDHNWVSVSTIGGVERFECTVCGQEKTEPIKPECKHDHQTTETVAATCGQNGCTKQICKDCGAVVRENVIEATGDHHWEVEYKCDATETEDGWIRYTCDGCNQSYTDIIPATGADNEVPEDTTPVNPYLDNVPRTGSFFLEWLYALIFG